LFRKILDEYGSRFYQEEIIKATKAVENCSFFIAPYSACAQLVQFQLDKLVNVVFGSAKLLCFDKIDQAIVDFDINKGTFTFIDRKDLDKNIEDLANYFVMAGGVHNVKFSPADNSNVDLLKMLNDNPAALKPAVAQ